MSGHSKNGLIFLSLDAMCVFVKILTNYAAPGRGELSVGEACFPVRRSLAATFAYVLALATSVMMLRAGLLEILVRITRSSTFLAQIMVLPANFLTHGKPSTMMSDLQHHSSDVAFSPMGALGYLNLPCGRRNVVMSELFGLRAS